MRTRRFGRMGWDVGELGYGMWGMAGWTGSDDAESTAALDLAVDRGVTFFDTAQAYGDGHSEQLLAKVVAAHPGRVVTATKVPPMNRKWPAPKGTRLSEVFPRAYVRQMVGISRANLGVETIDLLQLHIWEDDWLDERELVGTVDELRREKAIGAFGISLNRWEPWNGVRAVKSGLVDSVQVIYNIFDQAPEDELFPTCRENGVAVIARVPFDEGSLTGSLTLDSTWPEGDWRNTFFVPENLRATVEHVEKLRPVLPAGSTMAEMAIRFIISNPDVSTVIPGMRRPGHVEANVAAAEKGPLPADLLAALRAHRWDRKPTRWSQ
jgi:aryl-alcohol dehydrogenase-like predicted oxidoreductase